MLSSFVGTSLVPAAVLLTFALSSTPALAQPSARAGVSLTGADATLTHGASTPWTLEKSGNVDGAARTVTWSVSAIEGMTTHGELAVRGQISVTNTGAAGATIGNIVVNLQTRSGATWRTRSSDVADATSDDAATRAVVVPGASSENVGSFTENGVSGPLLFTDASTNSLFALSPKVTVAPGATVALLFVATFDNSVLRLRTGEAVRAEVIVSFGNSGPSGASAPRLDIDGSGAIDPDESYVRSVPARLGLTVLAETASQTPVLTDTVADIATTGTVSVSNAAFNLGARTGTVMVTYVPGALGGAITNCAHLRSTDGSIDVQACDTQTIAPASVCTPGTVGCGWKNGDVITYSQETWGGDPVVSPAAALLVANFDSWYGGVIQVGLSSNAGSMIFTSARAVLNYLPSSGPPGPLSAYVVDPTSTSSGLFGGFILALQLNVDFVDAGLLPTPTGLKLGDLRLCGLSSTPAFNGWTVRQFLAEVSSSVGAGQVAYPYEDLSALTEDVTTAFESGIVSTFAQQHLVNGTCPSGWQNGDVITYSQEHWGGDPATEPAAALVVANFMGFYGGGVEVGFSGNAGFSMVFTSPRAILNYLPASSSPYALNADLVDPNSTSSGLFGGYVLALQLNVDFADAGYLSTTTGLKFGDLRVCGLSTTPAYNGLTIRQLLVELSNALGVFQTVYDYGDLAALTGDVTAAFESGIVSTFAQQHLVNGTCGT